MNIFIAMFQFGIFPNCWKNAVVLPISKPGRDTKLPSSYRPISLLSTLSKIAEKLIATRLRNEMIAKKIIQHEQFGFQPNCSTARAEIY